MKHGRSIGLGLAVLLSGPGLVAAQQQLSCLRFDYSGHGRSAGRPEDGTISLWLEEARAVFTGLSRGPQERHTRLGAAARIRLDPATHREGDRSPREHARSQRLAGLKVRQFGDRPVQAGRRWLARFDRKGREQDFELGSHLAGPKIT